MEFTVHPLLHLVDDNRNGLKSLLTHYIDATVDYQFDLLKNSILKMIHNGLIDPLLEYDESDLTCEYTTQSDIEDHENSSSILHHFSDKFNQQNEPNASLEDDLLVINDWNQSTDDDTNNLTLINETEHQISQKSTRNTTKQNDQSVQLICQQSIPSIRSSGRKRIQKKMFGDDDDQSNHDGKSNKRKYMSNPKKTVKKMKQQKVEKIHKEEEQAKLSIVTLEVNCTEPDCTSIFESHELWKEHLSSTHDQLPYNHLHDSARHNQHGQPEYACTECETVCKSRRLLNQHWRNSHLPGKYQCSTCDFVANYWREVNNHYRKEHFCSSFQCTYQGCNQAFKIIRHLEMHQRIHSGEMPYRCTWHSCGMTFNQSTNAIRHVRVKHFRLPRTVKEQKEQNIIDERDPNDYVQVSRS